MITSFILLSNIVPISNVVFAEEYRNEKFQFSIEYPDNWVYEEDYGATGGSSGIVSFVDKLPDWTTEISIIKSNLDRNSPSFN